MRLRIRLITSTFLLISMTPAVLAETPCAPHIEEFNQWQSATLRNHTDAFQVCPVDESTYQNVIAAWLKTQNSNAPVFASLSLGRVIHYPWLSELLANAALHHPQWNTQKGHSKSGNDNAWVSQALSSPSILARLQAPFDGSTYRIESLSVEKVLVDEATNVLPLKIPTPTRVPFDAQLWVKLRVHH